MSREIDREVAVLNELVDELEGFHEVPHVVLGADRRVGVDGSGPDAFSSDNGVDDNGRFLIEESQERRLWITMFKTTIPRSGRKPEGPQLVVLVDSVDVVMQELVLSEGNVADYVSAADDG